MRALENAARLASDGNRYLQIAQLLFELRHWNGVVKAVDNALQKGDIKQAGTAHLLLGIASHYTGTLFPCPRTGAALQGHQGPGRLVDRKALRAEGVAATDSAPQAGM